MSPEQLLVTLYDSYRASVSLNGERIRIEAPRGFLTPNVREALERHKDCLRSLIMHVEDYRAHLRSASPASADLGCPARLIDELGPVLATAVRQAVGRKQVEKLRHV